MVTWLFAVPYKRNGGRPPAAAGRARAHALQDIAPAKHTYPTEFTDWQSRQCTVVMPLVLRWSTVRLGRIVEWIDGATSLKTPIRPVTTMQNPAAAAGRVTCAALDVAARHGVVELRGSSWKQEGMM